MTAGVPTGWTRYRFAVDARSPTIPRGWVFTRGDGTPGSHAEWAILMRPIDFGLDTIHVRSGDGARATRD